MPFYFNRRWLPLNQTKKPLDDNAGTGESGVGDAGSPSGGPLAQHVSTSALIAWQRQEISRLQKEVRRIQAEKDRISALLEREQQGRELQAAVRPRAVIKDSMPKSPFKTKLLSSNIDKLDERESVERRRTA